jgi:hypothetical protein
MQVLLDEDRGSPKAFITIDTSNRLIQITITQKKETFFH